MADIIPSQFSRYVEKTDTRLEIRRDESRRSGKKKGSHPDDEYAAVPWDDIAYVSVASLKTFLESIVTEEKDIVQTVPVHEASTTLNQRAASAYQSVGRAVHDGNVTVPGPSHIDTDFTESDFARMRLFIDRLADIERQGIVELEMERSDTFLDSIEAALTRAENKQPD